MDAIDVIIADHRSVQELFEHVGDGGDEALLLQLLDALDAHAVAEEEILYPAARAVLTDGAHRTDAAVLDHQEAERLMAEIQDRLGIARPITEARTSTDDGGAELGELIGQLRRVVEAHIAEEEATLLPELRDASRSDVLEEMARELAERHAEETGELDARGEEAVDARLFDAAVSPQARPDDPPATS